MDYDRSRLLLDILERTRYLPNLKPMHDHAFRELQEMADGLNRPLVQPMPVAPPPKLEEPEEAHPYDRDPLGRRL